MDSKPMIQIPILDKSRYIEPPFDYGGNKLVRSSSGLFTNDVIYDNEWQQEYYIIYNSYILEDNEPKLFGRF